LGRVDADRSHSRARAQVLGIAKAGLDAPAFGVGGKEFDGADACARCDLNQGVAERSGFSGGEIFANEPLAKLP